MARRQKTHAWKGEIYKSKFELETAKNLTDRKVRFRYEKTKLRYTIPAKECTYTPDFEFKSKSGKRIIIETKGHFTKENREKALYVRDTNPDLDIRFVFMSNNPIYRKSPTRYGDWCIKHGFKWALKTIPKEWVDE